MSPDSDYKKIRGQILIITTKFNFKAERMTFYYIESSYKVSRASLAEFEKFLYF